VEAVKREQRMAELREKGICPRCCERPVCARPPRKYPKKQREGCPAGPRSARFDGPTMTECAECRDRRLKRSRVKREERKNTPRTLEAIAALKPPRAARVAQSSAQKVA
jgi:hypothetical protein